MFLASCDPILGMDSSIGGHALGILQQFRSPISMANAYLAQASCMMNPRLRRQPGNKLGSYIMKSRFLDILDGLTAANGIQRDFSKLDHYYGGFERKMRRVGLILIKLSFDKDFK